MVSIFDFKEYGKIGVFKHDYIIHNSVAKSKEIWCKGLLEKTFSKLTDPSTATVMDIGAHCGMFSIPYALKGAKVISCEPQKQLFQLITRNFEINTISTKHLLNCAIGNKNLENISLNKGDEGYPAISGMPSNLGGVAIGEGGEEGVAMQTIDSMNLDALDFIKIDVEGAEPYVIEGGKETISKYKPIILYENNWKKENEYMKKLMGEPIEIKEFLKEIGYTLFEDEGCDIMASVV